MEIAEDIDSLVIDAAQGSSKAFAELVRLHQANIRYFLARFTSDSSVVDDLSQEVFLTAYRKLPDFKNDSTFSTWLHGIAKNKALHFLRSESRRKAREKKSFEASLMEWKANALEGENPDEQEVYLELLEECLGKLTPEGKDVIEQYYFQAKSSDEVGDQLNKGGGAVRMMLVRLRRALLKCVTKKKKIMDEGS